VTLRKIAVKIRFGQIALQAISAAAPKGPFGRLKKSFRLFPREGTEIIVYSLYYWARMVNDGRSRIANEPMLFYSDPEDDPRIESDYPRRRASRRKLTTFEYKRDKKAGILVETRTVAAIPPTHFIEKGVADAVKRSPKAALKMIGDDVDQLIRRRVDKISVRL
jgi:hypothetical protein